MKKFSVERWETITRTYFETVEAETKEEAKEIFWDKLDAGEYTGSEKQSDCDTYVTEIKETK